MKIQILVVEDDDLMRTRLVEALQEEGYGVTSAASGEAAVELAREQTFDLVVADIRMGGMDGLDAVARLRQQQPEVRSLVITGYSSEADSIRAVRLGVGDYLKKPFRLAQFRESVRRLVAQRRLSSEREKEEHAGWETALWAMQAYARSIDPALLEPSRLVASLGGRFGLSEGELLRLQLAVSTVALRRGAPHLPPMPASVAELVQAIEEPVPAPDSPPIPIQLALLGLSRLDPSEALSPSIDPQLLSALRSEPLAPDDGRHRRGLLSVAMALAEAGQTEPAAQAFGQVLAGDLPGRETVQALLGLGRLAWSSGRSERARELALKAAVEADRLGPSARGEALLEAGILLGTARDDRAPECLQRAITILESQRLAAAVARARLASFHFSGIGTRGDFLPSLGLLLSPETRADLVVSAPWLLEMLLEGEAHPVASRALLCLARDVPRELTRLLRQGSLTVPARIAAIDVLKRAGAEREALERLLADPAPEVSQAAAEALSSSEEGPQTPLLRLHSLGPFEVFLGGGRIEERAFRSQKVRYLLAYLAAQSGQPVPVDILVELFWPDDVDRGKKNVNWARGALARCLGPDAIVRAGPALQLNPDLPRWHDLEELERLLDAQTVDRLSHAVRLYRGPYLEGCYHDWALRRRELLARQMTEAALKLANEALERGAHESVLEYAELALTEDPCCQEAYYLLMRSATEAGRPEEALRRYDACTRVLRKELGLEPSIKLERERQRALLILP
ncbi:MAG: response regulator [Armatimonadetes bacterium]|nr:response regulator [Armatimonadota bacterium]